eukprot:gene10887-12043_t
MALVLLTPMLPQALPTKNVEETRSNNNITMSDVKSDFQKALNESESWVGATLLFRYPSLLQVILEISTAQNASSSQQQGGISNLTEYELCLLVKKKLEKTNDVCRDPSSWQVMRECVASSGMTTKPMTTLSPSVKDICANLTMVTTIKPPTVATSLTTITIKRERIINETKRDKSGRKKRSNNDKLLLPNTTTSTTPTSPSRTDTKSLLPSTTNATTPTRPPVTGAPDPTTVVPLPPVTIYPDREVTMIPPRPPTRLPDPVKKTDLVIPVGSQMPSSYFFLAIKVIAKTVILSNERRCHNQNGIFNPESNTCRVPLYDGKLTDDSDTSNKSSRVKNGTDKYKIVIFVTPDSISYALKMISIVCNALSCVGLVVLMATYCIIRQRFSLPDKNILSLSLSLCLSHAVQLLIVFFHENYTFCKTTGILLHWALLLVFFWMAAMSFDFFITFAKIRMPNADASNARFKKYLVVVVTTASIIVLACMFIGIPDQDYSGYGINGVCFVSKFWPNLFAFAIPVALILLANVGLLSATIFKLRALREASNKVLSAPNNQGSNSRKKIVLSLLTLKLSVLFGIGWILGYIDGVVKSEALKVCFNLVVSLQGTFVYMAFGSHKKMFAKLRCMIIKSNTSEHSNKLLTFSSNKSSPQTKSTQL